MSIHPWGRRDACRPLLGQTSLSTRRYRCNDRAAEPALIRIPHAGHHHCFESRYATGIPLASWIAWTSDRSGLLSAVGIGAKSDQCGISGDLGMAGRYYDWPLIQ